MKNLHKGTVPGNRQSGYPWLPARNVCSTLSVRPGPPVLRPPRLGAVLKCVFQPVSSSPETVRPALRPWWALQTLAFLTQMLLPLIFVACAHDGEGVRMKTRISIPPREPPGCGI